METPTNSIEQLLEQTEKYGKTTFELFKLKAIDQSSEIVSSVVSKLILITIFFFVLFIANIGIAFWIGDLLGAYFYGFFTVAAFYLFIGIVLFIFRNKWIKTPLRNSIISRILN